MSQSPYSKPDFFADKAKKEGYFARSVYKLKEIDEKYKIFKAGQSILDLGAFPGSFSQYALKQVGTKGHVTALDIMPCTIEAPNFTFLQKDITLIDHNPLPYAPFHCIMSDMAPNTTGIHSQDAFLSHELSFKALSVASLQIIPQGVFICKIFQGEGIDDFFFEVKRLFKRFKSLKPKAVRKNSKEIYVVAWELK